MSNHAKHFAAHGYAAMRVAVLLERAPLRPVVTQAAPALPLRTPEVVQRFFIRRLDGYGWERTICPNCPNSLLKSWGSAKPIDTPCPNCPNLPQPFLTCTGWKKKLRGVCGVRAENLIRATKSGLCSATVQLNGSFLGFCFEGNPHLNHSVV